MLCDPFAQNCPFLPPVDGGASDASIVQNCYYEPYLNTTVCEPVINLQSYESLACSQNSDCVADSQDGEDCFPLSPAELDAGFVRACRYFCDDFFDGGTHHCPGGGVRICVPVAVIGADGGEPFPLGACQPKI
jgi:hypothetical protein